MATTWVAPIPRPISRPRSGAVTCWITSRSRLGAEEGARDTEALASEKVATLLSQYQAPELDADIRARLDAYVAEKKATAPEAFA